MRGSHASRDGHAPGAIWAWDAASAWHVQRNDRRSWRRLRTRCCLVEFIGQAAGPAGGGRCSIADNPHSRSYTGSQVSPNAVANSDVSPFAHADKTLTAAVRVNTVEFYSYPGDDHNIANSFGIAMQRSVQFFDK